MIGTWSFRRRLRSSGPGLHRVLVFVLIHDAVLCSSVLTEFAEVSSCSTDLFNSSPHGAGSSLLQFGADSTSSQQQLHQTVGLLQVRGNELVDQQHAAKSTIVKEAAALETEEMGLAAPSVSAFEFALEMGLANYDPLSGPTDEGETAERVCFWIMLLSFIVMCFIAVPFVGLANDFTCCADSIGRVIEAGIEGFDKSFLGVDVEIGALSLNAMDGYLDIEDLVVRNPSGYTSKYLLKADRVQIDVDMMRLLTSFTNEVSVEKVVFKDIHAIMEKKWNTSNVQDVLHHLEKTDVTQASAELCVGAAVHVHGLPNDDAYNGMTGVIQELDSKTQLWQVSLANGELKAFRGENLVKQGSAPPTSEAVPEEPKLKRSGSILRRRKQPTKSSGRHYALHRVEVVDVGVTVRPSGMVGDYLNLSIAAGDVLYQDFDKEVGHSFLPAIIKELLMSILKTMITNVAGKQVGNYLM